MQHVAEAFRDACHVRGKLLLERLHAMFLITDLSS